jgi:hypothetical protein
LLAGEEFQERVMQVMIKVKPEATEGLQQQQGTTDASQALLQTAQELGVKLEPVHPGETDPTLAPFFAIEVEDADKAEQVRARFDSMDATEAAYLKPPDFLP